MIDENTQTKDDVPRRASFGRYERLWPWEDGCTDEEGHREKKKKKKEKKKKKRKNGGEKKTSDKWKGRSGTARFTPQSSGKGGDVT